MREGNRSDRRFRNSLNIDRQERIWKRTGLQETQPHRFNKRHAMDCGKPNCSMCGNRRELEGQTIQELSFAQTQEWYDGSELGD